VSGRHQPEAGADSEHIHQYTIEDEGIRLCECGLVDPEGPQPMLELPRPDINVVRGYLRQQGIPEEQIESEASKVVMADSLGRAIHAAKKVGGPWGPPCSRPKPGLQWSSDPADHHSYCQFYRERAGCTCVEGRKPGKDDFEPVPYGYDGGEFECECEAMALHLVQLMTADAAVANTIKASRIIVPGVGTQLQ